MLLVRATIWTKVNIWTNFLIVYTEQAITLAEIEQQRFLKLSSIKSLNAKLVYLLSNFQNDALKNLFIWHKYNSALPSSAVVELVFYVEKTY